MFATILDGETVTHRLATDRYAWIQVARGAIELNGLNLQAGDGVAVSESSSLELFGSGEALIFDLN